MKDLECKYDSRRSFYGKAKVTENLQQLYSYGTLVGEVLDGEIILYKMTENEPSWSTTTTRHQREWLKQLKIDDNLTTKEMYERYGRCK